MDITRNNSCHSLTSRFSGYITMPPVSVILRYQYNRLNQFYNSEWINIRTGTTFGKNQRIPISNLFLGSCSHFLFRRMQSVWLCRKNETKLWELHNFPWWFLFSCDEKYKISDKIKLRLYIVRVNFLFKAKYKTNLRMNVLIFENKFFKS